MGKLLHISAHVRRSPEKPAHYLAKHEQLRREVEARNPETADAFLDRWADAFNEALERDPAFAVAHMGLT